MYIVLNNLQKQKWIESTRKKRIREAMFAYELQQNSDREGIIL